MLEQIQLHDALPIERRRDIAEAGRFSHDLMRYLEEDQESRPKTSIFSASTIGWTDGKSLCGKYPMGCQRKMAYRYICVPRKGHRDATSRFRMDVGTAIHRVVQGYLHGMGASHYYPFSEYQDEVTVNPDSGGAATTFEIWSVTDGIYRKDGSTYCLEIKTIAPDTLQRMASPKPEHVVQIMVYMACLDIPVGNIFYIGLKPSLPIKEFMVHFDHDIWDAIVAKIEHVRRALIEGLPVKREGSSYACRRCDYNYTCSPQTNLRTKLKVVPR